MDKKLPVYLQWLEQPDDQDRIDLDKLYADAPVQWLEQDNQEKGSQWAMEKIRQGEQLALGRFNDRIVCAACLVIQPEHGSLANMYKIDKLCVRAITRERGVARQLLVRLCQWADETGSALYIEEQKSAENGLARLYELGFVQYLQGWRYLSK